MELKCPGLTQGGSMQENKKTKGFNHKPMHNTDRSSHIITDT